MEFPILQNDRLIKAAFCKKVDKVPVWAMRQAGRYLEEFRSIRAEHDFFTVCRTPKLACEVTLQPLKRFKLDAAIIFSDILVVPQAMGMEVLMVPGKGPVFPNPLASLEDLERLNFNPDVDKELNYVFEALSLTRHQLEGKVPLIGFSGAPWTLMAYMIQGASSPTFSAGRAWLYKHPEASHRLLSALTNIIIEYLVAQVKAGAQMLQLFESHAGLLCKELFDQFSLPYLKRIASEVKSRLGDDQNVPMTIFAKGAHYAITDLCQTSYDVISLDWTMDISKAKSEAAKFGKCLQGNLDPAALYANEDKVKELTSKMMKKFSGCDVIANLGHGMYPDLKPEALNAFVEAVHDAERNENLLLQ